MPITAFPSQDVLQIEEIRDGVLILKDGSLRVVLMASSLNFALKSADEQTAVVLMTHSFNKDVQYLMALKDSQPAYLGLLGSNNRRERVLSMLLDYMPDISTDFLEQIHGPAGISIGAESASEIAVSILAEILSVIRHQKPIALTEKIGSIHG